MEKEHFLSGYCRCMDCARTVTAITDKTLLEVDCDYPHCPHAAGCSIGKALSQLENPD